MVGVAVNVTEAPEQDGLLPDVTAMLFDAVVPLVVVVKFTLSMYIACPQPDLHWNLKPTLDWPT